MEETLPLLLAGVGPHARRFYLPVLAGLAGRYGVKVVAAVEIDSAREEAARALQQFAPEAQLLIVPKFRQEMPSEIEKKLDRLAVEKKLRAIIVATDPVAHKPYVLWAMKRGIHVLLDKPISTRCYAVLDAEAARGIEQDYYAILAAWKKARSRKPVVVSVCAHRRFHPGFRKILEIVEEVCSRTGCPVTQVHCHHADGQWRFPEEVRTQDHHSYHSGHGKASHSGHHFFDVLFQYFRAGTASGKHWDAIRVLASAVTPRGLLRQLRREDYARLFGCQYERTCPLSDAELDGIFGRFGEIDLNVIVDFLMGDVCVGQGSLNLLHNSFSRRSWLLPAKDLYKGNGRVKHEHHRVHVGPFLTVVVNSFQAKSNHELSGEEDIEPGGNNHFDILVFRNAGMIGGPPVETIRLHQLFDFDQRGLFIEQVKQQAVVEFLEYLTGGIQEEELCSPLHDHAFAAMLMSAIYESLAQASRGESPVVARSFQGEKACHA